MLIKGVKYHSMFYRRQGAKSNDGAVKLTDGFGEIYRIFECQRDGQESRVYVLVRSINVLRAPICVHTVGASAPHIKVCATPAYGSLRIVKVEDIERKVVLMSIVDDKPYLAIISNFYECD